MRTIIGSLVLTAATVGIAVAAPKTPVGLDVASTAFTPNSDIPMEYTCEGANISPPISWSTPPATTKSLMLVVHDPDTPGGAFIHWMVEGIPASTTSLPAGASLPNGAMAMKNGKGEASYTGPCPTSGRHHYVFTVYALDVAPGEKLSVSKADVMSQIASHVLARGQLIGLYQKTK